MKNCWSFSSFPTSPDKVFPYNGLSCTETHFFEEEHSRAGAASCPGLQPLRHEHTQAAFLSVFTFSLLLPPFTSPSVFCKAESHTTVAVVVKDSLIFTVLPRWPQTMVILLPQSLDSWIVWTNHHAWLPRQHFHFKKYYLHISPWTAIGKKGTFLFSLLHPQALVLQATQGTIFIMRWVHLLENFPNFPFSFYRISLKNLLHCLNIIEKQMYFFCFIVICFSLLSTHLGCCFRRWDVVLMATCCVVKSGRSRHWRALSCSRLHSTNALSWTCVFL